MFQVPQAPQVERGTFALAPLSSFEMLKFTWQLGAPRCGARSCLSERSRPQDCARREAAPRGL
eukprot:9883775-Alexandrium_andersonii.AAC.1